MKRIAAIILVLLLPVVVQAQEKLHITGNIEGISDSIKMVLSSGKQQQEFYLKDGKIDVSMALQEAPNFVQLIAYTGNNPKYALFFLDNESVEINGAIDNFSNKLRAMNSPHDSLRYENKSEINHLIKERSIYVDEFYKLLAEGKDRDSVAEVYLSKQQPFGKIYKLTLLIAEKDHAFIKKNINTSYGRKLMMYNVLNFTPEYAKELYDLIDPNYYTTDEVQLLKVCIDYPPLELGDKYYDFKAEDVNGNTVKFSEYFDGKYVMLDFSTFNCGFCQEAAPKTAKIADSLKDQLTYVTFYTGNDKKDKQKYFSELKGNKGILLSNSDNELFKIITMYRMTGTPSYFLFNPEGYLIEKLEGMQDDDFQEKIEELISK